MRPPVVAPRMALARPANKAVFSVLLACLAECCMYTCAISWAITPASSASLEAAVMVPMLMNIGPPGSAKALISFCAITWNSNGQEYWDGIVATSFCPSWRMYCVWGLLSGRTGICLYTWAAACRPSWRWSSRLMPGLPGLGNSGVDDCATSKVAARKTERNAVWVLGDARRVVIDVTSGLKYSMKFYPLGTRSGSDMGLLRHT